MVLTSSKLAAFSSFYAGTDFHIYNLPKEAGVIRQELSAYQHCLIVWSISFAGIQAIPCSKQQGCCNCGHLHLTSRPQQACFPFGESSLPQNFLASRYAPYLHPWMSSLIQDIVLCRFQPTSCLEFEKVQLRKSAFGTCMRDCLEYGPFSTWAACVIEGVQYFGSRTQATMLSVTQSDAVWNLWALYMFRVFLFAYCEVLLSSVSCLLYLQVIVLVSEPWRN